MRTDMKYRLTLAAIITLIPLALFILATFLIASSSVWFGLLPVYLFAGALIITFILSFVPFMKDHMWLSVTAVALLTALTAFILHMVV
ncbi:MAG: hypothetical protein K6C38_02670 [Saccharofermentans sp.]|nr:hypothetical protein [Saccharofermentans sp.]